MGYSQRLFLYFHLYNNSKDMLYKIVFMTGFEPWTFGVATNVTRLGDLLEFGPLFKAFGKN